MSPREDALLEPDEWRHKSCLLGPWRGRRMERRSSFYDMLQGVIALASLNNASERSVPDTRWDWVDRMNEREAERGYSGLLWVIGIVASMFMAVACGIFLGFLLFQPVILVKRSYPVTLISSDVVLNTTAQQVSLDFAMKVAVLNGGILPGQITSEHIQIPMALASEGKVPSWRRDYILGNVNFTDLPMRTHLFSDTDYLYLRATDVIFPPPHDREIPSRLPPEVIMAEVSSQCSKGWLLVMVKAADLEHYTLAGYAGGWWFLTAPLVIPCTMQS